MAGKEQVKEKADLNGGEPTVDDTRQGPFIHFEPEDGGWRMTSNLGDGEAKWQILTIAKELRKQID